MKPNLVVLYVIVILATARGDGVLSWFFGRNDQQYIPEESTDHHNTQNKDIQVAGVSDISFEINVEDSKFISEISEKLSDLDVCHAKFAIQLKSACNRLSEEELAKFGVNLLNCQAASEGRRIFPCTKEMSIKECTASMDPDTWNAYHIMSNRAYSVCHNARQNLFRLKSEITVNRLAQSTEGQLQAMKMLQEGQESLNSLTTNTYKSVVERHQEVVRQQDKLEYVQRNMYVSVLGNLRDLNREKSMIASGHKELVAISADIKTKLENARAEIHEHQAQRSEDHKNLLEYLSGIEAKAAEMWEKIENQTQMVYKRYDQTSAKYHEMLKNLEHVSDSVNHIQHIINNMRAEIDQKLLWVLDMISGTGFHVKQMMDVGLHVGYLLVGMVAASFINAPLVTRAVLLLLVPFNLMLVWQGNETTCLDFLSMSIVLTSTLIGHWFIHVVSHWRPVRPLLMLASTSVRRNSRNGSSVIRKVKRYFSSGQTAETASTDTSGSSSEDSCTRMKRDETPFKENDERQVRTENWIKDNTFLDSPGNFNRTRSLRASPRLTPRRSVTPSDQSEYMFCTITRLGRRCMNFAVAGKSVCYKHIQH